MEIILLEKINHLGDLGDKVKVKAGFGRNYLIPQGKAVFSSAENARVFEEQRAELEKAQQDLLAAAHARSEQLLELTVSIGQHARQGGQLFGSVGPAEIVNALHEQGIELTKSEVILLDGPLKTVGEHQVDIKLHPDVIKAITVQVIAQ